MNLKILALLACLALAGCGPVIPVPVPGKAGKPTPCDCECSIDEIFLTVPVPNHVWQEMLDELEEARRHEGMLEEMTVPAQPNEYPLVDK